MFYMPKSHLLIYKDNSRLACKTLPFAEQRIDQHFTCFVMMGSRVRVTQAAPLNQGVSLTSCLS